MNTNILIIQGGYSNSGVGEQFTEAMITGYPKELISRFSIVTSDTSLGKNDLGYPTTTFKTSSSALPLLSSLHYWKFRKNDLQKCTKELILLLEEKKIDLIWVILNGLYTVQLTAEIIKSIRIPMVAQIWDVPEHKAVQSRLDSISTNHMVSLLQDVMAKVNYGVTVSDSMGRIYKKRYGLDSSTMVFCPPEKAMQVPTPYNSDKKEINLVFAGSLYAYGPWNALLDAVESNNASVDNIKINVKCIGRQSRRVKKRPWVTYEKLKPVEEAAIAINQADIAYLPYWMSKKFEFAVQTAFPSKLSLYVASGTPVFYHGPLKSTPTEFLSNNKVGLCCHTLSTQDIIQTIYKIVDKKFQSQYKTSQGQTLREVFHPTKCCEVFSESVHQALLRSEKSKS